jgi:hypothetical protein
MKPWKENLLFYALGFVTGTEARYFTTEYFFQCAYKIKKNEKIIFSKIKSQMPELIGQMKENFMSPGRSRIREIGILADDKVRLKIKNPDFIILKPA